MTRSFLRLALATLVLSATPGVAALPPTIVFLGVDMSWALFHDEHFGETPEDLVKNKVPTWNHEACAFFGTELSGRQSSFEGTRFELDNAVSIARNETVKKEAIRWMAPRPTDVRNLGKGFLVEELEPYLKPGATDAGLLLVVDQMNKGVGVVAHMLLFERATGKVIHVERFTTKTTGFGVDHYYLNGLKRAIKNEVVKALKNLR